VSEVHSAQVQSASAKARKRECECGFEFGVGSASASESEIKLIQRGPTRSPLWVLLFLFLFLFLFVLRPSLYIPCPVLVFKPMSLRPRYQRRLPTAVVDL
jgi:hypothetical protein